MWAAAPVCGGFQASCDRLNSSRSLLGFAGLARQIVHMSQYIPQDYIVQEWLLEMSGIYWPYSGWYVSDIKLESLILAQNERWRHA
ncbi:hypothetical protein [Sphingobium cupriresistens]|uniref:Uncharacterized protein n=1 Tax=Sphingobium cupriresistens TaxID=1132417 RepID=A0A8G1ZCP0_9SPHN|nr:hypothetical protein [Sphingobium cupriresistens]RYM05734.1 hypothetical protein EWH12_20920 [Sphingobium cupriresistens]